MEEIIIEVKEKEEKIKIKIVEHKFMSSLFLPKSRN